MKTKQIVLMATFAALLLFSTSVRAHHGYAAYDMTTMQTLKGTITDFQLINPHSLVTFDVTDASGTVQHWYVEWGTVRDMHDRGVTPDSLKPGDQVTVYFHPAKGGKFGGVLMKVEFPDGRVLPIKQRNSDQGQSSNPNQ